MQTASAVSHKIMKQDMFSNKDLRNLIIPLFIEQFLLMFVGIADTFAVSFSGDADVSGVSLVTSFNTVLIFLFTALSSGGAVIISQYIGGKNKKAASRSAGQLLTISTVISMIMAALILVFRTQLLRLLFGKIEADVMAACESYLWITTLSLPFLAGSLGNGLRAAGDVKFTMIVSITLTIAARLFFSTLFGLWLGWGVIGVAVGMSLDLVLRGAIFIRRLKSQKWTRFRLI